MEGKATERVNSAINMLRNDLIEMRTQDVKLMKQLLYINFTIQKMTNERLCNSDRTSHRNRIHSATKRQESVPAFIHFNRDSLYSSSSIDELSEESTDYSDIDDDLFSKSNVCDVRQKPKSDEDESSDEEILRTNIKLWKYSKAFDSD